MNARVLAFVTWSVVSLITATDVHAQGGRPYAPPRARTYAGSASQPLTAPSTATPAAIVAAFLNARGISVSAASLSAGDPMQAQNGVSVVRVEQRIAGLQAYGIYAKVSLTARGEVVHLIENLVAAAPAALEGSRVNESQALNAALRRLYPGENPGVGAARREGNTTVFARTAFFHDAPTVTRVAVVMPDGSIRSGLLVDTWSQQRNQLHQTLIGPDGAVLFDELRTSSDHYNVFTEDPLKTPQQVVEGPDAWLFAGSQNSINIAGNNVNAYLDVNNNNRVDAGGVAVNTGDFLTSADLTQSPATSSNREVSVQNLFYLNNVLHDVLYQHGFTESAGNFQENNFGLGGAGSDSVNAEAQDGGGTDNANFATPTDGRNPRMQMYLWTGAAPPFQVVINTAGVSYGATGAEFGPAPTSTGITGDVILVNDGVGTTSDGCEGAQAAVSGKIALVDRGTCNFTVKVLNAQAAGAIAVIVANNQGGTDIVPMGGTAPRIRIPAVMISQNDGAALKALSSPNATIRTNPNVLKIDGSFDSDVVNHEYGHGLSWRIVGGMSGPLAAAIGEGASDGLAMLLNGDDIVGEYAASSPTGIRRYPYHDYPLTYGDVTGAEEHDDGEIYGAIIWRLIEIFDKKHIPISTLLDYFVDGMKFTPSTPAFEDMRDGILQSTTNAGGADNCLVWDAFAQFGVGVGAVGVATGANTVSITESFDKPASCPGN